MRLSTSGKLAAAGLAALFFVSAVVFMADHAQVHVVSVRAQHLAEQRRHAEQRAQSMAVAAPSTRLREKHQEQKDVHLHVQEDMSDALLEDQHQKESGEHMSKLSTDHGNGVSEIARARNNLKILNAADKLDYVFEEDESSSKSEPRKSPKGSKNVLFLLLDDMRADVHHAYGFDNAITPNLDTFSARSTVFRHAYVQQALCGPSRASFLTGRRPDATRVYNLIDSFRTVGANWTTMPGHFKQNGFTTTGSGKIFHPQVPPKADGANSWNIDFNNGFLKTYKDKCNKSQLVFDDVRRVCVERAPDIDFVDYSLASACIDNLAAAKEAGNNFFVACGFRRPHPPFRIPEHAWERFNSVDIALPAHPELGRNVPALGYSSAGFNDFKFKNQTVLYGDTIPPKGPAPDDLIKAWRQAYFASLYFLDQQLGRIFRAYDQLGLGKDTVVAIMSDHGVKLGEHAGWSKQDIWETSTKFPFMLHVPWLPKSHGKASEAIVEAVDVFPTLADLAGVPLASERSGSYDHVVGRSVKGLLEETESEWESVAFSQHPRCALKLLPLPPAKLASKEQGNVDIEVPISFDINIGTDFVCHKYPAKKIDVMGYSVRTRMWRYNEWRRWQGASETADWSAEGVVATELYLHNRDNGYGPSVYDDYEFENLNNKEQYAKIKSLLRLLIRFEFKAPDERDQTTTRTILHQIDKETEAVVQ